MNAGKTFNRGEAVRLQHDTTEVGIILNGPDGDGEYVVIRTDTTMSGGDEFSTTYWDGSAIELDPDAKFAAELGFAKVEREPEVARVFVTMADEGYDIPEVHTYLDVDAMIELLGEPFRAPAMAALVSPSEPQVVEGFGTVTYAPVHRKAPDG